MPDAKRECATCLWWKPADPPDGQPAGEGECRRYAPRPSGLLEEAIWPTTSYGDWCGEWQPEAVAQQRDAP